jgi:hypothetical protein
MNMEREVSKKNLDFEMKSFVIGGEQVNLS